MRKLSLALAASLVVAAGTFASPSNAMTLGPAGGLNAAIAEGNMVDQVRMVCTHFYDGRWHYRERCMWVPNHRHGDDHRGWHSYGRYGR